MPGWHDRTKTLQEEGAIRMVGIVQEQHPARARLFMQWKRMGWPILVDSLDLLDVAVVPITLLIDEHGVVRARNPRAADLERFLATEHPAPEAADAPPPAPELDALARAARAGGGAGAWRDYADALFLWGGAERLDEVVAAYERAVQSAPEDGRARFRLGVALRRRFESRHRRPGDFQAAVEAWGAALAIDPNQYIRRRRIQQYGPRLDKPYPFYDWVAEARDAIRARGEQPVELPVDPRGAELAGPARDFGGDASGGGGPDPEDRIHRDDGGFIRVEATVVPAQVQPGGAARVHLFLRPNEANRAHWNNEARDLVLWLDPPDGLQVDHRRLTVPNPDRAVSRETRTLEFEVRVPEGIARGAELPLYALYYVCEDVDGTCLYRRQDLTVKIPVRRQSGEEP